jgi:hypothetical protein
MSPFNRIRESVHMPFTVLGSDVSGCCQDDCEPFSRSDLMFKYCWTGCSAFRLGSRGGGIAQAAREAAVELLEMHGSVE